MKYLTITMALLFIACKQTSTPSIHKIAGEAQGSTYHIKYISASDEDLKPAVDSILQVIDRSMSAYRPDSMISKINAGEAQTQVDAHFEKVFRASEQIWKESGGLFDPTVGVLVRAWGFGSKPISEQEIPSAAKIDSLKAFVGFEKVKLTPDHRIEKTRPEIIFDFNAIAQGYTSDVIADFLKAKGITNFIVEVGGEMYLSGRNTLEDTPWTIGVENPVKPLDEAELIATVQFTDAGLATSGNYRKVWTDSKGRRYVHSINPLTGLATQSDVLSATVIAPTAMLADGYATMFMVMGFERSKQFLEAYPDFRVLLVYTHPESEKVEVFKTQPFAELIAE